ncbi:MAG: DUF4062 domain-containing protein [Spirochaetaceae bacterium]
MKPKIFISSTCYDLSQIRQDISDFFNSLGFTPILSDKSSFPINPNNDTLTNCIENVRNNADLFILIIGNRYGSIVHDDKSITNMEYRAAKKKGIPIYIFTLKQVLTTYEFWNKNKTGNFEGLVDNVSLFEFIKEVRITDKNWCFEFENANDIKQCLKDQISYLFKNLLDERCKNIIEIDDFLINNISPSARKILIQEEDAYEFDFFYQVLLDEFNKIELLQKQYEYELLFQSLTHISDPVTLSNWARKHLNSMTNFSKSFITILNNQLNIYFGEPGEPADLNGLFLVACTISKLLKEMINCSLEIKSTSVEDEMLNLRDMLGKYLSNAIEMVQRFPINFKEDLDDLKMKILNGEDSFEFGRTYTLEIDENLIDEFDKELIRLGTVYS